MSTEYFSGRVHSIVFSNESQDFYILKMIMDAASDSYSDTETDFFNKVNQITVRGCIPGLPLKMGSWIGLEGEWVDHPDFGKQVKVVKAPVIRDWTTPIAVSLLSANGVGGTTGRVLEKHFGASLVKILNTGDSKKLLAAKGLTPLVADHVIQRWKVVRAYYSALAFLSNLGISKQKVADIWQFFGDDTEEILSLDPWRLVEIEGITFPQADEIARNLSLDMDSPRRLFGAVLFATKVGRGMGHLFMTAKSVVQKVNAFIPEATSKDIIQTLKACHDDDKIVLDRKTIPGMNAVYEKHFHIIETQSASLLKTRVKCADFAKMPKKRQSYVKGLASVGTRSSQVFLDSNSSVEKVDLQELTSAALQDWTTANRITLSEEQTKGALNALTKPFSILTGLPGTGKTTTLRSVIGVLENSGVSFLLMAPTGIAAKRLSSVTNAPAATLHRALGAKGAGNNDDDGREHNYTGITGTADEKQGEGNALLQAWECSLTPHSADVVFVDEASMVDQHLFYRLLSCTKPTARIVLVGDPAQLPSVGPGNVLNELIKTQKLPTTHLKEIFRQQEASKIVLAAHSIYRGEVPDIGTPKDDFVLIPAGSEEQVLEIICKLAGRLYQKKQNFQIISPRHGGTVGVTNLNANLRELLNPRQPGLAEMRIGQETLREGDRVMVIKNDYELNVFNGDTGKVLHLHKMDKIVDLKLHGPPVIQVKVPFKKAAKRLRMAYAITVHKSQGMEYDVVVIPWVKGFSLQLQRNLLYTAITRGAKKVILVGHQEALRKGVRNNRINERHTLLQARVVSLLDELENESASKNE